MTCGANGDFRGVTTRSLTLGTLAVLLRAPALMVVRAFARRTSGHLRVSTWRLRQTVLPRNQIPDHDDGVGTRLDPKGAGIWPWQPCHGP